MIGIKQKVRGSKVLQWKKEKQLRTRQIYKIQINVRLGNGSFQIAQ